MDWIIENGNAILEIALKVVGAFSVIASLTPNTTDNKVADALMPHLEFSTLSRGKISVAKGN